MEKQTKMKKSTKYLLIGTLVLFLSILGASMAYYLARVQGTLNGRAAGTELDLTITQLSTSATDDLIPLDSDVETLNLAAKGYGNEESTFDASKACIDINGYSVCQIYRVRVTNNGSVPLTMNGTVTLYGQDTPNIDCAKMDDEVTVTNNNSCMGTNILASNVVLPANNHLDYYVMVYINNLDESQYDKGEFNGTVTFTSIDGKKVKGRFKQDETLVDHITKLYSNNKDTTVTNNSIEYQYATSVNLMNDRLGGTTNSLDDGNIRYYGATPNNYIDIGDRTTNGEVILWRIIGVFDGKLRIRRDENIGNYLFDTSAQNVNNGYGINKWSQADLMKLLNPGYEINQDLDRNENTITVNNSLYWNSRSGYCYQHDFDNNYWNVMLCDFTNTGLSDEAKEYVVDQTLYLGGFDSRNVFANEAWTIERGNNVFDSTKSCYGQRNCNDTITRTFSWTGKVGLIYPSDFGYAADFSDSNCESDLNTLYNCTKNWMVQDSSWTISPWAESASIEMCVYSGRTGINYFLCRDVGAWPTLLLDSSVFAESGNGTKDTPYVVAY